MTRFGTCLWYDNQAEEAASFYVSLFNNPKIRDIGRYSEAGPGVPGSVMTVSFELDGNEYLALNGGPVFQFTEAVSIMVHCETQAEVDFLWGKLTEGGEEGQCGWLKDRWGLSWQIIPDGLMKLMSDRDPARALRATQAMFTMKKLDVARILQAANQEG